MPRRRKTSRKRTTRRRRRSCNKPKDDEFEEMNFGEFQQPFTLMPFGPQPPWIEQPPKPPSSSGFGSDLHVNPSGYLSLWYGAPNVIPPSWNPLLRQGGNIFQMGINEPKLSQVYANTYSRNY
jgi:hypothetical protein